MVVASRKYALTGMRFYKTGLYILETLQQAVFDLITFQLSFKTWTKLYSLEGFHLGVAGDCVFYRVAKQRIIGKTAAKWMVMAVNLKGFFISLW